MAKVSYSDDSMRPLHYLLCSICLSVCLSVCVSGHPTAGYSSMGGLENASQKFLPPRFSGNISPTTAAIMTIEIDNEHPIGV